ncbi:MAG TPA: hypothetical protein PKK23_02585 [Nitrospirales bacterium]|nr:hypothetical protein [Nitrospiraceae bacterium]HNP27904.1 hypothetical protein [Nitrospirales bacterium]
MLIQAVAPIRVKMPEGSVDLVPGQTIELSNDLGQKLLRLAPGRVQVAQGEPFQVGDRVAYRVPDTKKDGQRITWSDHSGQVLQIDAFSQMILIEPFDETGTPWRWIWWGYVQMEEPTS